MTPNHQKSSFLRRHLGARVNKKLVDATGRVGYALTGWKPKDAHETASEYYQFDWEYAQTPEQSSWIASSWVCHIPDFAHEVHQFS